MLKKGITIWIWTISIQMVHVFIKTLPSRMLSAFSALSLRILDAYSPCFKQGCSLST